MEAKLKYYYINLKHRVDRNTHMIKQFQLYGIENYERIDACTYKSEGRIGCTMSHIKTLEQFLASEHKYCMVFEDDFMFLVDKEAYNKTLNSILLANFQWDVILFSSNIKSSTNFNSFLNKVLNGQTTSSYLVTKEYAKKLLENYKEALAGLKSTQESKYCIDIHWKLLQPNDNWFVTNPIIGKQMPSYSDIINGHASYRC